MASNFNVFMYQTGENLHFRLSGGLDGSSAYELTRIIDQHYDDKKRIFVHTSGLLTSHLFGVDILKTKYSWHKNLVFTG